MKIILSGGSIESEKLDTSDLDKLKNSLLKEEKEKTAHTKRFNRTKQIEADAKNVKAQKLAADKKLESKKNREQIKIEKAKLKTK